MNLVVKIALRVKEKACRIIIEDTDRFRYSLLQQVFCLDSLAHEV